MDFVIIGETAPQFVKSDEGESSFIVLIEVILVKSGDPSNIKCAIVCYGQIIVCKHPMKMIGLVKP
jgi:hypothetical protein